VCDDRSALVSESSACSSASSRVSCLAAKEGISVGSGIARRGSVADVVCRRRRDVVGGTPGRRETGDGSEDPVVTSTWKPEAPQTLAQPRGIAVETRLISRQTVPAARPLA
jgi:hypothetical protein